MKYNFDEIIERRGTNSYKWDLMKEDEVIPMWVADMDFPTAPAIIEALQKRVAHGIFGYTLVPDSYYEAIINWFSRRHQWNIERDWILYTSGVVPALSCTLKAITMPGEKVLVQTPVYNCFFSSIKNNGCEVVENELRRVGNCTYEIDFEDFERKCADEKTTAFILCNPHNPAGRVWKKEELERMNDICMKHGVKVIADEIHCELVMPGYHYTPFASISEACRDNSVTLNSPTKAFNIAGLQIANIICPDAALRRRIDRAININEVCDVNPFGVIALQAAYNEGEEWLDELNQYLWEELSGSEGFLHHRASSGACHPIGRHLLGMARHPGHRIVIRRGIRAVDARWQGVRQQRYAIRQKGWSRLPPCQHRLSSQDLDARFGSHRKSLEPIHRGRRHGLSNVK